MNRDEIVKQELEDTKKDAANRRTRIKKLLSCFEYSSYANGYATIETFSPTFKDYLELSAKLPVGNELSGYDLYWRNKRNDSLVITHSIPGKTYSTTMYYSFIVGDVERTLEKLTEGKCKVIEKTTEEKPTTYTTLSCNV